MKDLQVENISSVAGLIADVEMLLNNLKGTEVPEDIEEVLLLAEKQLNYTLYMSQEVDLHSVSATWEDDGSVWTRIAVMLPVWKESLERRKTHKLERQFWTIYEYFKYVDPQIIVRNTMNNFDSYPQEYQRQFTTLPRRYSFLTGRLDVDAGDYSLIPIYVDMMKSEGENFKWLFQKLADKRSKQILLRIVTYWFEFDVRDLAELHEGVFDSYYDLDLLTCTDEDVLVDCGAYVGDSILSYIQTYGGQYRKIYGYEIAPETMVQMKENLKGYDRVEFKLKGVGREHGMLYLDEETSGEGTKIADTGVESVEVVALDEDIEEPVTIIKMDIEGAEQDALQGARRHIEMEKPRLLICTYHKPADLFQIPRLIDSMRGDYTFYLRINGRGIWPCDHVLFGV